MIKPLASFKASRSNKGFTLIELLIVIVIIGILAAISIVGYSAVISHAHQAALQQDLDGASDLLASSLIQGSTHAYPTDSSGLAALGIKASSGNTFSYNTDGSANPSAYCLENQGYGYSYFITNTSHNGPTQGYCNGVVGVASTASGDMISFVAGYPIAQVGGAPTPGPATNSKLGMPSDIAFDSTGNMYIADENNIRVEKVTPAGILSVIAGNGTGGSPTAGPSVNSELRLPESVATDSAGNLYIADTYNEVIEKIDTSGTLSVIAGIVEDGVASTPGPALSSHLNTPSGVVADAAGNIYVAEQNNDTIDKITPSGQLSYVAGISGSSGTPTPGPATSSKLDDPNNLTIDAHGNLYIADYANHAVEKIDTSGNLSVVAGIPGSSGAPTAGPATSSKLGGPADVAVDPAGNLYIADLNNSIIEKVTVDGQLSVIAGNGTRNLAVTGPALNTGLDPFGVAFYSGSLYIADMGSSVIEKIVNP